MENSAGGPGDYYTPPEIFAALDARFDLDPAHPGAGTPHCCVPALDVYAVRGLDRPWRGFLWLNPPFGGRREHVRWLDRMLNEDCEGIALCRAYTSADWFHQTALKFDGLLFPLGKTQFVRPDGSIARQPGHGIVLLGKGERACVHLATAAHRLPGWFVSQRLRRRAMRACQAFTRYWDESLQDAAPFDELSDAMANLRIEAGSGLGE